MKTLKILVVLSSVLLAACGTTNSIGYAYDDVYYTPSDKKVKQTRTRKLPIFVTFYDLQKYVL